MITKDQALTIDEVHSNVQKRNGQCYTFKRNGRTQTWKTKPNDFRLPIKNFGLRIYGAVTHESTEYHAPEDCPANQEINFS